MGPNRDWEPSEKAFQDFLNWLDGGPNSDGQRYLEVRRRLELYFDRKNCIAPCELADETLNRVIRKLEESGEINGVAPLQYCYTVATYVFLEALRADKGSPFYRPVAATNPGNHSSSTVNLPKSDSASDQREKIAEPLQHCLASLSTADRELIGEYYRGQQRSKTERRAALAARLGVTTNALSIRAYQVRQRLEVCIEAASKKTET